MAQVPGFTAESSLFKENWFYRTRFAFILQPTTSTAQSVVTTRQGVIPQQALRVQLPPISTSDDDVDYAECRPPSSNRCEEFEGMQLKIQTNPSVDEK
jgi:hypothetical protein